MQTLDTTAATRTTDGTQTIIYQGRPVRATLVNYLSGTIPTSTVDAEGDEELFRDEAGRYYLRRTLNLLADHHEDHGEGNIEASGRTHVHRINVNAAILWATTRLNSDTLHLRQDAAALLMEGRGYTDPHPSHLSVSRRELIHTAAAQGKIACAGQTKPSLARPSRFGVDTDTLAAAARYAATAGRTLGEMVDEFLEAMAEQASAPSETDTPMPVPSRIVVELDDLASAMLRQVVREGNECRHAGEDPRDLVNAAVTFYLSDAISARCGAFDLEDGGDALERAKAARLGKERA